MKKQNLQIIKITITFVVVLFFSFNSFSQTTTVIRGPYLQSGTLTSTIVKWRTSDNTDSQVWFGTDVNNLNQTVVVSGSQTDHEVVVSGLVANTIYYYAIGDSGGQMAGGNGDASHYFKTAPTVGSSAPVTAWILGDCGTADLDQDLVRDAYYNYIGNNHTDMVLLLGDNAYDDGFDSEYQDAFFDVYPDKLKNSIFWSCPGNHDYFGSGLNNAYYDIFSFPTSGEAGGLASNTEKYYSFDYANIHIISLDSHDENRNTGSPMLTWLENDLAATTQKWIIVIFHHPPYSKGSHDSDDSSENRMIEMRENVLPICESYGVDLVLSGHSHAYERSKLINGHYGFSNTYDPVLHDVDGGNGQLNGTGAYQQDASVEGTVYVVTGSAGGSSPVGNHPVMHFSKEQLGSTILEVNGNQMDVKFLNENGVVEDSLTFVQNGQPAINWTNPNNGNVFTNLNPIDLNVAAFDSDGNVTQVEYFINGVSIGVDVDAPYSLSWTPPAYLNYLLKATATDNEGNTTSKEISISIDNSPTTNLVIQINDGDDDAEEFEGDMRINSADLDLVDDGQGEQTVGLVFNGLNIPTSAIISNAYIQFTTDGTDSGITDLMIHGENTDSSFAFNTSAFNLSSRSTTSASVNWIPSAWSTIGEAGLNQQTPDLSTIVQEIIDRSGWEDDNSMGFIISGTGTRTADSYNGSSSDAATLHISFELNLCAPFFDADNDGYCSDVDCDDTDPNINPGITESCDGIDNNCNGQIDEGAINSFYADIDNDDFGDPNNSIQSCTTLTGYVSNNTDCNDNDGNINPNATEICDGIDNNCDGQIDEGLTNTYYADVDGDGFGDPNNSVQTCSIPSGYVSDNLDCDDSDGSINPNGTEICDGLDNNCDGQIDEGLSSNTYYADADSDGFGDINSPIQACATPIGYVSDNTDCDDSNGNVNPNATEICDGLDNNCDGQIDEGLFNTYYADTDSDGFGDVNFPTEACSPPAGYVSDNSDCDDSDGSINPGASEVCDGLDNNCNGQVEEGLTFNTYYIDLDSDGFGDPNNSAEACSTPSGYVSDNTDCDDTASNIYIGATCDDNNQFTIGDVYESNCICAGEPLIIPPTVSWAQPTAGQFFTNLNSIALNVNASDLDGSVTQVEYFVNGVFIGIDVVAPYSISWTPTAYGNYLLKTTATDNAENTSSAEISIHLQDISPVNIAIQINDGDDDAEESGGSMGLSSSDLEMVEDGSDDQTVGLVFNGINIPTGAVISNAYIQFTTDEAESTSTNLTIHGEDTDNSLSFTSSNSNITSRPTTSASVNWIPEAWSIIGEAGLNQQTPDLSVVVQEIIDRPEWGQNNSMGFIISGVGARIAESYDGSPADAATLHVTFEINPCVAFFDMDNDGFCSDIDCDDTNPNINTSAIEICDGIDNNCDGQIDEGVLISFYADADSDGFGDPDNPVQACTAPSGYVSDNTDCDDSNGSVNPSATEICDGIDNNCDGQIDEGLINTYYIDADSDGFGDINISIEGCTAPSGYVTDNTDCDDSDGNVNPSATEICDGIDNNCDGQIDEGLLNIYYADADSDGFGDINNSIQACTAPSGYVSDNTDCDDSDGSVNPSVTEICDGIDNNCDGQIDEDLLNTYYVDTDSDGFGDINFSIQACTERLGYVTDNTDCDDSDGNVNSSATEICDGIDNNCDGQMDEGLTITYYADVDSDGFGDPNNTVQACSVPSGYVSDNTDCDDSDGSVNPTATEVCDGVDNNCDGQIDEGVKVSFYADIDSDGFGDINNSVQACSIPAGYVSDNTDCDDNNGNVNPGASEICDGVDNNCDGQVDEGLVNNSYYADTDSDGFGDLNNSIQDCSAPSGYVSDNTDCDDTASNIYIGASCNDGDPNTVNDIYNSNCICIGVPPIIPPTVIWTNPINGQAYTNLNPIALNVNAFDIDGSISQVEYFVDGVSIGIDVVAPYSISWTPPIYGTFLLKATATDNAGNTSSEEISILLQDITPVDIVVQINNGDDDAEESGGSMILSSSDLEMVEDGSDLQTVGLVFNGLNIPSGATITNAYIQFTTDEAETTSTNLTVRGEDTDNALSFTSSNSNLTSRPTTSASINWIPPSWSTEGEAGTNQQTPDLSTLVQEIVDRAGWAENNSMGFIISGNGTRVAESYDGSPSDAATLHVTYSLNSCAPLFDVDNDGFCSDVDCDDTNATVYPGAIEICDGLDNNCDGQIDEGVLVSFYADTDGDGFGEINNSIQACSAPLGYVSDNTDCDDTNITVYPGGLEICDGLDNNCDGQIDEGLINTYYVDTDSDGFGDPNISIQDCSAPSGYVSDNTDCDDTNATVYPGAIEICDGIDNNCDGQIDEGLINTYYVDTDNDGFGDPNNSVQDCSVPSGYVSDNTDCDDTNVMVYPGAIEICDGLDNNCDGQIDEGLLNTYYADTDSDGFGDINNSVQACTVPSGYVSDNTDCDDSNGSVNPSATEICDGIDNNCDGQIDEGLLNTYYADTDSDGFGDINNSVQACTVPSGYVSDNTDCDDTNGNVNSNVIEICDGIDNNCDGQIDEGLLNTYYADTDNDGYGGPNNSVQACTVPSGYVVDNTDCDDSNGSVNPSATEVCDGIDNNCDGQIDEGLNSIIYYADTDSDGFGDPNNSVQGCTIPSGYVSDNTDCNDSDGNVNPNATEVCDGVDNNCDGQIDEGLTNTYYADTDSDGFGDINFPIQACTVPSGYVSDNTDCDDSNGNVNPSATEICDGIDNNCNGQIDEGVLISFYADTDSDGFGDANNSIQACTVPAGYVVDNTDCDDSNGNVNPNATEICDEIDNNCDGQVDEDLINNTYYADTDSDGFGDPNNSVEDCSTPSGYVSNNTDCDDTDPNFYIGATCDDGDPNTINDIYDDNCICIGQPLVIPPTVTWTNPTNGQFFTNLNSLPLNVDAFDTDGSVTQVECFVNGVSIGVDVDAPYSFSWTPPAYAGYLLNAIATDNAGNIGSKEISITVEDITTSITVQINDEDDDAEEFEGDMNLTSSDLEMVEEGQDEQTVGLVFNGLNIPSGAVITNAYIQFTTDETDSGNTNLTIHGENTDNSLTFNSSDFNITSRPTTSASVDWTPLAWSSEGEAGVNQQTPDLSTLVQEIVDRPGWAENNSMGFIISGDGKRNAVSYNGSPDDAAILHITYIFITNPCAPFFDLDNDGFCSDIDCDDTDPTINPSASEICDGIDNNCNGQIDEGVLISFYADTDSDGFGDINNSLQACSVPSGYVLNNTDCDDSNASVNPTATEVCDGIDNNCDGQIDEGVLISFYADTDSDGFGDPNNSLQACSVPSGYVLNNTDCDDSKASVNPTATEVCDGIDNNCDGQIDEGLSNTYFADVDTDGFGDANNSLQACSVPSGYVIDNTDCDDSKASVNPTATEVCDGIDNNCNGQIDEGLNLNIYYADTDTDGFGDSNNTIQACSVPSGYVIDNTDCDDSNQGVNPSATEACDGLDNNCDGQIDEGVLILFYADTDSDGFGDVNNTIQACSVPSGYVSDNTDCDDSNASVYPNAPELCDDLDNNCDGQIDEGLINVSYFADTDSDGFGDPNDSVQDCSAPAGYVSDNTDCDDTDPNIYIGASCDDANPNTINDIYGSDCICLGEPIVISTTSITIQINDNDDDAEESGGDMNLTSSDLEMVEDGSDEQTVGLVFNGLNIPTGAVITNAYIQFTADETGSGSTNLTIHGEDTDNSLSFTSSDFNLTSRPTTSASVNWIPSTWSSEGEAGIDQQTSDLSTLVQEIVDRAGWEENNSMGFIISGNGVRTAVSYNGSPEDAATLHVTFSTGPPVIAPTVSWTNPTEGQVFTNLNPITLDVDAFDNNGSVTQVEYFVNGISIGIDATAPYSLNWIPTTFGNYLLKATATDNDGNTTSEEISITLQNPTTSITIQISDEDDDAEESGGDMNLTSSDLEMVEDGSNEQTVGLVFNGLNIPTGAVITNAYIQFTTDETDSESTNLTIHGEDVDNSLSFTSSDFNLTSRPTTSASVNWTPSAWSSEGEAGTDQQTPDLSTLVQGIVDRAGWEENNSMGFIISGNGVRTAVSYNGSPEDAATLHVTFEISASNNFVIPDKNEKHPFAKSKAYIGSVDAQEKNTLHFFPNPIKDHLNIHYKTIEGETTYVELIDLNGKRVVAQSIQMEKGHNEIQMDLSEMPNGLYFLRVMEGENYFIEKVIVNR